MLVLYEMDESYTKWISILIRGEDTKWQGTVNINRLRERANIRKHFVACTRAYTTKTIMRYETKRNTINLLYPILKFIKTSIYKSVIYTKIYNHFKAWVNTRSTSMRSVTRNILLLWGLL